MKTLKLLLLTMLIMAMALQANAIDICEPCICEPCIEVTKTVEPEVAKVGDEVIYEICIINNCEDTPLVVDTFDDTLLGSQILPSLILEPKDVFCETFPYTIKPDDPDPLVNEVTVKGVGPCCDFEVTAKAEVKLVVFGGEGCTPGYWKNSPGCWEFYVPYIWFMDVFDMDITIGSGKKIVYHPTLMEALNGNGGGVTALARHAVAAMLNAYDPDIDYQMSEAEIIAAVQQALYLGEPYITELKDVLDYFNNAGCPQSSDNAKNPCSPSDD
jgi:uncharacterized repeat protein (TIGR01451 family)